jgi:peroxiredoxin
MFLRNTLKIILATILLSVLITSCSKIEDKAKPKKGYYAPDFTLTSLDGKVVRLSDLRGKIVFINIWATWCPPCKEEIPSMARFYSKMKNEGVEILAISEDRDENALIDFVKKQGLKFPIFLDPEKKIYNLYKATGVPETHLIDKSGIIKKTWIGPFNWIDPTHINNVKKLIAE